MCVGVTVTSVDLFLQGHLRALEAAPLHYLLALLRGGGGADQDQVQGLQGLMPSPPQTTAPLRVKTTQLSEMALFTQPMRQLYL